MWPFAGKDLSNAPDPLSWALSPPRGETEREREERLAQEYRARQASLQIDEELKVERLEAKAKRQPVKLLFLGQSESGKSTTIKNFQLKYAHQAWLEERAGWRIVIYMNLVRSVNSILDVLTREMCHSSSPPPSPTRAGSFLLPPYLARGKATSASDDAIAFTGEHKVLKMRLGPLRHIQADLESLLGSSSREPVDSYMRPPAASIQDRETGFTKMSEFFVRSNHGWKTALVNFRIKATSDVGKRKGERELSPANGPPRSQCKQAEDVTDVIVSCRSDIKALWLDVVVQNVLIKHNIRLDDSSGFFLDDVDRIANRNYEPSDEDIMRARLRTIGVQEYRFIIGKDSNTEREVQEWIMYDVAGVRTSRASWLSFFDDVNAIIFLAPISCFDESLAEDSNVNRLEDSFSLWDSVCSSKVLLNVQLMLFLNKCDLLKKKLKRGNVKVRDFLPKYEGNNDFKTVTKYILHEFRRIQKKHTPQRSFYAHFTSVIDPSGTVDTVVAVKTAILQRHLNYAALV